MPHDDAQVIAKEAQRFGWAATVEPLVAGFVPDLLVITPDNRVWIVELKERREPLHMADLGQMVEFRDAWKRLAAEEGEAGLAERASAVLITNEREPTEFFRSAARDLDVVIWQSRKTGVDRAREFIAFLRSLGQ